ncbi:MAG: hypothetical protein LC102_06870 [Ignavibacteriales bacterium]|nr:MAG: hypothetical protein F9K26_10980 [Ignavibacteriaceae bacterium]MBW7874032.1 hypothetical protein [Ignavibacteria bacterium]MCZ2143132.1 hypothetical protein [Ignavibacteriales bacterium]OQY71704.1 MAG: hypothetical protein B6D45_09805 [Ignavibacteriales bacterium UTCHB3]MBV6444013.1 hypothetical protein [Ignavibacteriaceae bacterium]
MENLNKVARVAVLFWILRMVTVTLAGFIPEIIYRLFKLTRDSDFIIFIVILALTVTITQITRKKYVSALFWSTFIILVTLSDALLGIVLRALEGDALISLILFLAGFVITIFLWYQSNQNLDVYPIKEQQREIFYWVTFLFANGVGEALEIELVILTEMRYWDIFAIFVLLLGIVVLLHYSTTTNRNILFWLAIIFTQPLGYIFKGFMVSSGFEGGLGLGLEGGFLIGIVMLTVILLLAHNFEDLEKIEVSDIFQRNKYRAF